MTIDQAPCLAFFCPVIISAASVPNQPFAAGCDSGNICKERRSSWCQDFAILLPWESGQCRTSGWNFPCPCCCSTKYVAGCTSYVRCVICRWPYSVAGGLSFPTSTDYSASFGLSADTRTESADCLLGRIEYGRRLTASPCLTSCVENSPNRKAHSCGISLYDKRV